MQPILRALELNYNESYLPKQNDKPSYSVISCLSESLRTNNILTPVLPYDASLIWTSESLKADAIVMWASSTLKIEIDIHIQ